VFCGDLNGKEIKKKKKKPGYISDLLCCIVETNNIVKKETILKNFLKTTMRHHLTPFRMTVIKKTRNKC